MSAPHVCVQDLAEDYVTAVVNRDLESAREFKEQGIDLLDGDVPAWADIVRDVQNRDLVAAARTRHGSAA